MGIHPLRNVTVSGTLLDALEGVIILVFLHSEMMGSEVGCAMSFFPECLNLPWVVGNSLRVQS